MIPRLKHRNWLCSALGPCARADGSHSLVHWNRWLRYSASLKLRITNLTRNTVLGDSIESADTSAKRRVGLLKHERLEPGDGLWIVPCESVHTFFMKFPIDLVYLGKDRKVRKVRHAVKPWRLSACLSAYSILELPAGAAERTGTRAGDELQVESVEATKHG